MKTRRPRTTAGLSGVLPVDKAEGPTSFDVVRTVRRALNVQRVGHAGTLDPFATGLLLVLVGEATKITPWLISQGKQYEARICLGVATDTYDCTGRELRRYPVPALTAHDIETALRTFVGPLSQVPPMYSAIKQDGRRLYSLARQGVVTERAARPVTVYELTLSEFQPPDRLSVRVHCSSGFYVRSLAHDLGAALGCGAHLQALRRLAIGSLSVDAAVTLAVPDAEPDEPPRFGDLHDHLIPWPAALAHLPALCLNEAAAQAIAHGRPIPCLADESAPAAGAPVRALDAQGRLLAIVECRQEAQQPPMFFVVRGFTHSETKTP